ncbi:hypothetical protein AYI69_g8120 [Smittium culicis]|uniref:Uncharacterized protein n=1 Tax=Smittium culicis TaxID=133412 RepID=A0A1R1XLW1_9FUNG|nr:hypothetical protein AYI69_g8120 [Smittium culicis]
MNLTDMSLYKEVSINHMLFGGEMTCHKKLCIGGSDMKVRCSRAQFKGDHIDALDVVFTALKDVSYIRPGDHHAGTTYMLFNNKEDAYVIMATLLVYNDKPIDLYQTCLKIKKNAIKRNATENMQDLKFRFNSSKAELPPVSADPKPDDSKSEAKGAQPSKQPVEESKNIKDTEVSANDEAVKAKNSTINRLRIPSSPIEKVSSGDDTESDSITDDNNQPKIKRTTKSTSNSDDFSDISMDSDMCSLMEIKKEFIPRNPSPKTDSDGYSPPSEHALMAAKARMGQISLQKFNKFVSNVDKAP